MICYKVPLLLPTDFPGLQRDPSDRPLHHPPRGPAVDAVLRLRKGHDLHEHQGLLDQVPGARHGRLPQDQVPGVGVLPDAQEGDAEQGAGAEAQGLGDLRYSLASREAAQVRG